VANGHLDVVKYLVGERAFTFVLDNEGNGPLHLAAKYKHPSLLEWLLGCGGVDKSLRNNQGETFSNILQSNSKSKDSTTNSSHSTMSDVAVSNVVGNDNSSYTDEVLKWTLVCPQTSIKQDKLAALSDLDISSWHSFCFSVLALFSLEGISRYMVKDKLTKKYDPKQNEDIYRSIPTLVEYMVLMEQDGDEGSGHVKDMQKFYKILNKIYRSGEGMAFEMRINGDILKKYQNSLKKSVASQSSSGVEKTDLTSEGGLEFISDNEETDDSDRDNPLGNVGNGINSRSVRDSNRRLLVACEDGNSENARAALINHAEVNCRNDNNSTSLHLASQNGHLELCQILVEAKCFKNNRNSSGRTPLLNAVANGHLDVVKYLVGERAFTFVLDNEGNGPLHLAAKYKHPSLLEWLLHNCDIDSELQNGDGHVYSYFLDKKLKNKFGEGKPNSSSVNVNPYQEILPENFVNIASVSSTAQSLKGDQGIECDDESVSSDVRLGRALLYRTEACLKACIENNFDIALQFLDDGIDVNGKDLASEMTPLHLSIDAGQNDFVERLLQQGADVNVPDKHGNTPLHYAAQNCNFDMLSMLQSHNAEILGNEYGFTPLHQACSSNHEDVAKFLISSMGASVSDIDYSGNTSLHFAVESKNESLTRWMCLRPDAAESVHLLNVEGLSPYDLARNSGQIDVANLLHHIAEDKKISDAVRNNSNRLLQECRDGKFAAADLVMKSYTGPHLIDLDVVDSESGKSAVHFCAEAGDLPCVLTLIDHGAQINLFDCTAQRQTALHYACSRGHTAVAKELLSHGAVVDAEDQSGCTPLFVACRNKQIEVGCLLVENFNVDLNHVNWKTKDSILHVACAIGSLDWVKLIEKYSELTILSELQNKFGLKPLDLAVNANHTSIILHSKNKREELKASNVQKCAEALCRNNLHEALNIAKAGINPNSSVTFSDDPVVQAGLPTVFHLACERGDIHIVKEFISQGASVSLTDSCGATPLHYACVGFKPASILNMNDDSDQNERSEVEVQSKQLEIVRWLKKCNADINAQDNRGYSPLMLACLYGNVALAQWLLDRGGNVNVTDTSHLTIVHLACESGSTQLVKWLLNDMHIKPQELDPSCTYEVLMRHASKSGNVELLVWMYHSLGVDRDVYTRSKQAAMEIKMHCMIKHQEKKFRQAALDDNINVMEIILAMTDLPIDIDSQDVVDIDTWETTERVLQESGDTALHKACRAQRLRIVEFLVHKMANVNAVNANGITPLHLAVINGNFALFDLLMEHGAQVNSMDNEGNSILTFACMLPDTAMAEKISSSYCQFDEFRPNLKGKSAIIVATDFQNYDIVIYFAKNPWISRQIKKLFEATFLKNIKVIKDLIGEGISVNVTSEDSYRRTPLHIAASLGEIKIMKLLLEAGGRVDALDSSDRNVLHIAASCGAVEIVKLLMEEYPPYNWLENANPEERTNTDFLLHAVDELGMTPIAHACLNGQMITAAFLIGQGASLSSLDVYGSSILHLACKSGNISLVQWLMDGFDMDFTALNYYKQTPIDSAADAYHEELVQFLSDRFEIAKAQEEQNILEKQEAARLAEIARIEQAARDQEQAKIRFETEERELQVKNAHQNEARKMLQIVMKESLCKSCQEGDVEDVREILSCDINPNMVVLDEEGKNGLHIAASNGHASVVEIFLKVSGVDCDIYDGQHMTALMIACAKANGPCIKTLVSLGADPLLSHELDAPCAIDIICSTDNADMLRILLTSCDKNVLNRIRNILFKRNEVKENKNAFEKSLMDRLISANSFRCIETIFEFIVPHTFDLDTCDGEGRTYLNVAASVGHVRIVDILLKYKPDVNTKDYQMLTPLMNALLCQSLDIVKLLVNAGATIYDVDAKGNTPLHLCCDRSFDVAVWLLNEGVDIYCENADGLSPLQLAELKKNDVLIKFLKNKHNNVLELSEVCQSGDLEWARRLIQNKVNLQQGDKNKVTGLHLASYNGHVELCRLLVSAGCIVDVEDAEGRTPLHYACMACNSDIIQLLVGLGASLFRQNSYGKGCGHFIVQADPLHVPTDNLLQCLKWLVEERRLSVNQCDDDGNSVAMTASCAGNVNALEFLQFHGASMVQKNRAGCNAFHLAVQHGKTNAASWLLEQHGNDLTIDIPDDNGRSAFMIACENGKLDSIKWLYDNGCNFKQLGSSIDTRDSPLHAACRCGDTEICALLLDHAADISLLNSKKESPIDVARINSFEDLIIWLEERDSSRNFEVQLREELELSMTSKSPSTALQQALFDDLYSFYLTAAKADESSGTSDCFELASFLLNVAAMIGNLDNIRDLVFNTKHLSHRNQVSILKDHSFDIINAQFPCNGRTALFHAVLGGHLRATQFLLTHGARCGICDHTGRNPVLVAKQREDRQAIYEVLLSYANEEDLYPPVIEVSDEDLYTNHWMHEDEKSEAALQLMKYCYLGEGHFDKVVQVIEDFGADVNYKSAQGLTPLLVACHENHINLVQYLVDGGADINCVDRHNTTSLMLACRNENKQLALYLINHHADLTVVDSLTGETALHIICENDMANLMEDIINLPRSILRRLDLKVVNPISGFNILHCAVLAKSLTLTTLLVRQGLDVNACNKLDDFNTPLHYACMTLEIPLIEFLLSKQAKADVSNSRGVTPLALVLKHHDITMGRLLQDNGADVTEIDPDTGDSFLHKACRDGKVDIAKWLLRSGVDPNTENKAGMSATKLAHASGREDLLEWILAWILSLQLKQPVERVLTEAHTLPIPQTASQAAAIMNSDVHSFLSSGIVLGDENRGVEGGDPADILEFD